MTGQGDDGEKERSIASCFGGRGTLVGASLEDVYQAQVAQTRPHERDFCVTKGMGIEHLNRALLALLNFSNFNFRFSCIGTE